MENLWNFINMRNAYAGNANLSTPISSPQQEILTKLDQLILNELNKLNPQKAD